MPSVFRNSLDKQKSRVDSSGENPFRLREDFLTSAEIVFYHFLQTIIVDRFIICPKVALSQVISVTRPNENVHFFKKISQRNIDFLLCTSKTIKPIMGIELAEPKNKEGQSKISDSLQNIFNTAGLPLVRIPISDTYETAQILPIFRAALLKIKEGRRPLKGNPLTDYSPICPKCGITMVLRIIRHGIYAGRQYYGCMNFPECKERMPVK